MDETGIITAARTYRDEIQRQARPAKWVSVGVIAAIAILPAILRSYRSHLPPNIGALVALGIIAVFVIIRLVSRRMGYQSVLCPKCKTPLGVFAAAAQGNRQVKKISYCPYCAVNLDDPMPPPAEEVTTPDKLVWK